MEFLLTVLIAPWFLLKWVVIIGFWGGLVMWGLKVYEESKERKYGMGYNLDNNYDLAYKNYKRAWSANPFDPNATIDTKYSYHHDYYKDRRLDENDDNELSQEELKTPENKNTTNTPRDGA